MSSHQAYGPGSSQSSRSGSPHVTLPPPPSTYTLDQLDVLEEQCAKHAVTQHLMYAVDHVIGVLTRSSIPYGIMGGMCMILLGYRDRTTRDVDIAVDANPRDLVAAFSRDERIYKPSVQSVAGSGTARIFVMVGPGYGQMDVRQLAVEVDLILSGNRGAPHDLANSVAATEVNTSRGRETWYLLDVGHLFKAKLGAYYHRETSRDIADLCWIVANHGRAVQDIAPQLDIELRAFFADHYAETEPDQRRVTYIYQILGLQPGRSSSGSPSRRA